MNVHFCLLLRETLTCIRFLWCLLHPTGGKNHCFISYFQVSLCHTNTCFIMIQHILCIQNWNKIILRLFLPSLYLIDYSCFPILFGFVLNLATKLIYSPIDGSQHEVCKILLWMTAACEWEWLGRVRGKLMLGKENELYLM